MIREILLGGLGALGDSRLHLVGLAQAPADDTVAVADHYDGREAERTATLGDLRHAVDGHKAILQIQIAGGFYSICFRCHVV